MWARIGSLFILSKHLGNASQVWVVGVVRARGGVGTHWQPLNTKHLGNASQVCVVARKRRPGGVWAVGVVLSKHSKNETRCG